MDPPEILIDGSTGCVIDQAKIVELDAPEVLFVNTMSIPEAYAIGSIAGEDMRTAMKI